MDQEHNIPDAQQESWPGIKHETLKSKCLLVVPVSHHQQFYSLCCVAQLRRFWVLAVKRHE